MGTAITYIEHITGPSSPPRPSSPVLHRESMVLERVEWVLHPRPSDTETAVRAYVTWTTTVRLPLHDMVTERLDQLWREGKIAWSGRPFRPTYPKARARGGNVADLLIADRG